MCQSRLSNIEYGQLLGTLMQDIELLVIWILDELLLDLLLFGLLHEILDSRLTSSFSVLLLSICG